MHRYAVPLLTLALVLPACGRKESPLPPPAPTLDQDSLRAARARADSIARARADADAAAEAARAAAEAAMRARAALEERIHFGYDEYALMPSAEATLLEKVAVLQANPDIRLRIEGHADERGSLEYNLALGLRRANVARDFLVASGLDAGRFQVVSYGEERPLAAGSGESAWAQNRRDEFVIIGGGERIAPPRGR